MRTSRISVLACLCISGIAEAQTPTAVQAFADARERRVEARRKSERFAPAIGATDTALQWLAANQVETGAWDPTSYREPGNIGQDCVTTAGMTGLVLTLFAARGYTAVNGPYQVQIRKAMQWVRKHQTVAGAYCITANTEHALLTWGMAEQAILQRTPDLSESVARALGFLIDQQNPDGGFHDLAKGNPSTLPATYWAGMPLVLAARSGILAAESKHACEQARQRVTGWLQNAIGRGTTLAPHAFQAQTFPASRESQTDAAIHMRSYFVKFGRDDKDVFDAMRERVKTLPVRDRGGRIGDPFHFFFATHAASLLWGKHRRVWAEFANEVAKTQRRDGLLLGSFDPVGQGTARRSRMLTTTLIALGLQAGHLFPPSRTVFDTLNGSGARTPGRRRGERRRRRKDR